MSERRTGDARQCSGQRILAIHPGALGDVLQAVPALGALREAGAGVALAGQARLGELLAGTAIVHQAVSFDSLGLATLFGVDPVPPPVRSRLAAFDRVISWFGARAAPYPARLRAIVPETLVAPPVPEGEPPCRVWEHLLATLQPWGAPVPLLAPLRLPDSCRSAARRMIARLADPGRPLLVVHPGAGAPDKHWAADGFACVIREARRETGCEVLVHQGPADESAVARLYRLLDFPALRVVEPTLPVLAALLGEAGAYLGADSGVSHLAAAVGAPAIILFPPGTKDRWAPWSPTALPLPMPQDPDDADDVVRGVVERISWRAVYAVSDGAASLRQGLLPGSRPAPGGP